MDREKVLKVFSHDITPMVQTDGTYQLNGVKMIQGQIFREMLMIDEDRAITTMKAWQRFVHVVSCRQRCEPFNGLDDYLPYRISDAGELSVRP